MTKIKAGALQFVVFIGVVIAILLGSFLTLVHIHNLFSKQTDITIQTIKNADIGIAYAIQNNNIQNDSVSIDLLSGENKSVVVAKSSWGVFEKVASVSKLKNKRFSKFALTGRQYLFKNRPALYLKDNNRPLVVVGNTKIEGMAYLPQQGVRSGNIGGTSYFSRTFIYGQTRESKNSLPELSTTLKNSIKKLSKPNFTTSNINSVPYKPQNIYKNSFSKPTQYILNSGQLNLTSSTYIGNIVIWSTTKIIVHSSSILKDVILLAPEIEIQNSTKGNFQAIATKKITVGRNCHLEYPSALVLNDSSTPTTESNSQIQNTNQIQINKESTVKGVIIYLGNDNTNNFNPQIIIDENAQVFGEVYCNQNLELKGTVNGAVFTSKFIAKQFGSIYQNHIYHGKILNSQLPEQFVGLDIENKNKSIIKWLY